MAKSVFGRAGGWCLIEAPDFDLEVSMTCGQIFGWEKCDGAYWGLVGSRAVGIRQEEDRLSFTAAPGVSQADVVRYFGLDEDLETILQAITVDDFMEQVVSSVKGLRLLRQDPWPCLCSYIISANNRVDRIDLLVKEIARQFGNGHRVGERLVYGLPDPQTDGAHAGSAARGSGAATVRYG